MNFYTFINVTGETRGKRSLLALCRLRRWLFLQASFCVSTERGWKGLKDTTPQAARAWLGAGQMAPMLTFVTWPILLDLRTQRWDSGEGPASQGWACIRRWRLTAAVTFMRQSGWVTARRRCFSFSLVLQQALYLTELFKWTVAIFCILTINRWCSA